MKIIGMLDSPYVRRAVVSFQLLGLKFEHQSLSVFRGFEQFKLVNPVVKAPTLLFDDGEILMDSSLIVQYGEAIATRSLLPKDLPALARDLRLTALALAACEKAVQIVYEHGVRPPEKLHQPWMDRVTSQLLAACGALEEELGEAPLTITSASITQAGVSVAITWQFIQALLPEVVPAANHAAIGKLSAEAEALPEFAAAPHGEGTYSAA